MNQEKVLSVLLGPIVSEKTTTATANNQYVFKVRTDSNKREIRAAVEELFSVAVVDVQVLNVKGKTKRNASGKTRRRPNWKKVYVRLEEGQEIEFADTPEEKQNAEARLRSLNDHVQELLSEIKSRQKTLTKITDQVTTFDDIKSKITTQIKKQTKSKPSLRSTISSSHHNATKVLKEIERRTKTEEKKF